MSSQDVVESFSSAITSPTPNYEKVYQDITALREQSGGTVEDFGAKMMEVNKELFQQGMLPDEDQNGKVDFILVDAQDGNIVTMDPETKEIHKRDMALKVVETLPAVSVVDGEETLASSNETGDPVEKPPGQPDEETDGTVEEKPEEKPPEETTEKPPEETEKPPEETEKPPEETTEAPPEEKPTTGEPKVETWGNREFTVNPDGSAEYTIEKGDTLWSISKDVLTQRLGREPSNTEIANFYPELAKASNIDNPDLIYPDNKVVIPPAEGEAPKEEDKVDAPAPPDTEDNPPEETTEEKTETDPKVDVPPEESVEVPPDEKVEAPPEEKVEVPPEEKVEPVAEPTYVAPDTEIIPPVEEEEKKPEEEVKAEALVPGPLPLDVAKARYLERSKRYPAPAWTV